MVAEVVEATPDTAAVRASSTAAAETTLRRLLPVVDAAEL
jgi:hypothetical protein